MKSRSKTLTEDVRYGKKVIALEAQVLERLVDRVDAGFQRRRRSRRA